MDAESPTWTSVAFRQKNDLGIRAASLLPSRYSPPLASSNLPGRVYAALWAPPLEFRQMLQTLLAERVNLKVHREMKEMPVYALVVGKNGPKLKESALDASSADNRVGVNGRNQSMTASAATMEKLADTIRNIFFTDRPVLDKTGLTGTYAFKIEATPEFRINNSPELSDISVFTAVQEQLGLKLEPQKAMMEILVVDHIEKPSGN